MTIASYSDLQTAVQSWLERTGDSTLTGVLSDLIRLAEQRIFWGSGDAELPTEPLRIRAMETYTDPSSYVTVAGTATLALPAGFLGMTPSRVLSIVSGTGTLPLGTAESGQLPGLVYSGESGLPRFAAIEGENLRLAPTPDAAYGVSLGYYKAFDPLATTPTNWLLSNAPGVYLYATLLEAAPYLKNADVLPIWARMFAAAIGGLKRADKLDRWGGALQTRVLSSKP